MRLQPSVTKNDHVNIKFGQVAENLDFVISDFHINQVFFG